MTDKRFRTAPRMIAIQTFDDRVPVVLKVIDKLRKSLSASLILLLVYRSAEAYKGIKIVLKNWRNRKKNCISA